VNYLLVVDHLGLGGAQRQLVELACGLKARGHRVEILVYFPQHAFFRQRVEERQIVVHEYHKNRGFSLGVIRRLRSLRRSGKFDIVISYLNSPTVYAELANLLADDARLIVSERCSHHDDKSWLVSNARRLLHVLADRVVTNSQTHARWLRTKYWLQRKVTCIYNGVDLGPAPLPKGFPGRDAELRLLAVGRVCPQKNVAGLIAALDHFQGEHGYVPRVSWAGKPEAGRAGLSYERHISELLAGSAAVNRQWRWLGEQPDMRRLLREHDVLVHPSLYEGLPNAVCEALAAGVPVLASNVCDHPLLVADGVRGFIFEPDEPRSIAGAIDSIARLSAARWEGLCVSARRYAEANLAADKMVGAYENLSLELMMHRMEGVR
jgi:glycosyltransferase involved in cell wall biosynthesis